jgi:hypothetical protein
MTLILAIIIPDILAHAGHDHGNETAPIARPAHSTEHPFVAGRLFEVVIDRCDVSNVNLYISDSQTNQPVVDAQVEATASGDVNLTVISQATKQAGVYLLPLKANDGNKITIAFKISTPTMGESLSLTIPQWPKASKKCVS